jgi:hypothetical protein
VRVLWTLLAFATAACDGVKVPELKKLDFGGAGLPKAGSSSC